MLLFVDTETSGLPDFSLPIDHPSQPHIIQLAAWLGRRAVDNTGDYNGELEHIASLNMHIRPTTWTIHPAAGAVHGITLERALAVGEELEYALRRFYDLVLRANEADEGVQVLSTSNSLIAHNLSFDHRIILAESARAGFDPEPLSRLRPFCTMRALTPRMRLPSRRPGQFKWPSLDEAHRFCFNYGIASNERHTAMGDVLACRDIYLRGLQQGWWK